MEFQPFDKIARLKREIVITEKLDGTNAQIAITFEHPAEEMLPYLISMCLSEVGMMYMYAGSRKRWVAPEGTEGLQKGCDNFGFARWARENSAELFKLGEGRHYGEWYGKGIQRGYGLDEKRFALFNVHRWGDHNPNTPRCCEVVTRIHCHTADEAMETMYAFGSFHVEGYDNPEGIIVYHTASRTLFKQTFEHDSGKWKGGEAGPGI